MIDAYIVECLQLLTLVHSGSRIRLPPLIQFSDGLRLVIEYSSAIVRFELVIDARDMFVILQGDAIEGTGETSYIEKASMTRPSPKMQTSVPASTQRSTQPEERHPL